jgi:hypothetical protein
MTNVSMRASEEIRELSAVEMQTVAGGALPYYAAVNMFVSPLDIRALNPQPLPPRQIVLG